MNDEKQKSRSGWYWWALLLPVIYVLSAGPVGKIFQQLQAAGYDVNWAMIPLGIFYSPLNWVCDYNEYAEQFLTWYLIDLWQT